jgi:hypothetical protein
VATTLLIVVNVELRGVPTHAWEASTAQVLLGGSCLVRAPLPDTTARCDLSVFSISVWAMQLDSIPPVVNLIILEPTPVHAEFPAVKRSLLYKVQVSLLSSQDVVRIPIPRWPAALSKGGSIAAGTVAAVHPLPTLRTLVM